MASNLFEALENQSSETLILVRSILDRGAPVDERNPVKSKNTPLHEAACNHSVQMLELLLERGASIDARNEDKMTPLMSAISSGKIGNCKLLLERGADPTLRCYDGKGTLHLAVDAEDLTTLELLLDHGVDINMLERNGASALGVAIMLDLRAPPRPASGKSPEYAVARDTPKHRIMRTLIDRGTALDKRAVDGATILHTAALVGELVAVRMLLDAGADPNTTDDCHRKPLWAAVRQNHIPVVKLLLPRTKDIDNQIYTGHTFLSTAARWGHKECVRLLLDAGARIWSQDPGPQFIEPERRRMNYGCDAMYWACDEDARDPDVVEMVLEEGAKRSPVTDRTGQFPEMLGIWERAVPEELEVFVQWVNARSAACTSAEVESLRKEIVDHVYVLEDEKRRKLAEEIGIEDDEDREGDAE